MPKIVVKLDKIEKEGILFSAKQMGINPDDLISYCVFERIKTNSDEFKSVIEYEEEITNGDNLIIMLDKDEFATLNNASKFCKLALGEFIRRCTLEKLEDEFILAEMQEGEKEGDFEKIYTYDEIMALHGLSN